jgi:predicted Rossmann-fold nucleotide-binding protein
LIGTDYWSGLLQQVDRMVREQAIDAADLSLLFVTDSVDDAIAHVRAVAIERFGLAEARRPRPSRWLGEAAPHRPAASPP